MLNKNLGIIIDSKYNHEGTHYIFADEKNLVATNGHALFCEPRTEDIEPGYYNPTTLQKVNYEGIPFPGNYENLFKLENLESIENPVFITYNKKEGIKNLGTKKIANIKDTKIYINLDYLKKACQFLGDDFTLYLNKENTYQPILLKNDKEQRVLIMSIREPDLNDFTFTGEIQVKDIKQVVKFKNCYVLKKGENIIGVFTKQTDAIKNADAETEIIETILK